MGKDVNIKDKLQLMKLEKNDNQLKAGDNDDQFDNKSESDLKH